MRNQFERLAVNTVIGDHDLCAWQPVRGVCWVQTRNPRHARRLAQRQDGRRVMVGVSGGYLRTFEFKHPITWAARLIGRYTSGGEATNGALAGQKSGLGVPEESQGVMGG